MPLALPDIATLPKLINEVLILAALRKGERHGYRIALDLEKESGGAVTFKHGTLYPILQAGAARLYQGDMEEDRGVTETQVLCTRSARVYLSRGTET